MWGRGGLNLVPSDFIRAPSIISLTHLFPRSVIKQANGLMTHLRVAVNEMSQTFRPKRRLTTLATTYNAPKPYATRVPAENPLLNVVSAGAFAPLLRMLWHLISDISLYPMSAGLSVSAILLELELSIPSAPYLEERVDACGYDGMTWSHVDRRSGSTVA